MSLSNENTLNTRRIGFYRHPDLPLFPLWRQSLRRETCDDNRCQRHARRDVGCCASLSLTHVRACVLLCYARLHLLARHPWQRAASEGDVRVEPPPAPDRDQGSAHVASVSISAPQHYVREADRALAEGRSSDAATLIAQAYRLFDQIRPDRAGASCFEPDAAGKKATDSQLRNIRTIEQPDRRAPVLPRPSYAVISSPATSSTLREVCHAQSHGAAFSPDATPHMAVNGHRNQSRGRSVLHAAGRAIYDEAIVNHIVKHTLISHPSFNGSEGCESIDGNRT